MKGGERKVREEGGHKLKKFSEYAVVFLLCWCGSTHDLRGCPHTVRHQGKSHFVLALSWAHLYTVINIKSWGFGVFLHETAHQHPREGTWVITICVVHLYIRKKYEVSVYLRFRGRCWYVFWALLGFFFSLVYLGFFFHTATGTSCGNLEMLNTVLNKCGTTPKWVFFLSQGGFVVCFLWLLLITKTLTLLQCACGMNYSARQGKKGHFEVHFEF